jgi:hypothetical protein
LFGENIDSLNTIQISDSILLDKHKWIGINSSDIKEIEMTAVNKYIIEYNPKPVPINVIFRLKFSKEFNSLNWFEDKKAEIKASRLRKSIEVKPGMILILEGSDIYILIINLCNNSFIEYNQILRKSKTQYLMLDCAGKNFIGN